MKAILFSLFVLYSSLLAKDITIAAAANTSYVIKPLIKAFNKEYPNIQVKVRIASSGKLYTQIVHGAPYSIFMSADMHYPQSLYKKGLSRSNVVIYAKGKLAMLSTKKQDFSKGLEVLKGSKITKIAIANAKTAPYGVATVEALKKALIYEAIRSKLVYAESISQTISYTITATDIGIVAISSLSSASMKKYKAGVNWVALESSLYKPIRQGIVLLEDTKEAKAWLDFIQTDKAKAIIQKFGYELP